MASIFDYETWQLRDDVDQADHDKMIRTWFNFVRDHQEELFPEWRSARYFREVDPESDEPTGRFIMLFEYESAEARRRYKERRKDYAGPYQAYKAIDPYQYFNVDTVTVSHWEPQENELWLDFHTR